MSEKKYWMVYEDSKERIIWGVSDKSPTNAHKIAENRTKGTDIKLSRPIPCSENIFNSVYFAATSQAWTMINDIAEFDSDINTVENCNEMRGLIDGAYDIIFIYKPETPSQVEWKKNWLEKAKKHGASLE